MSESRGGWELTKENIQPLSSGRRMACLAESLPVRTAGGLTDQLQYEELHLEEIKKLEEVADKKLGDDPLQRWVDIVKYFEQHFPNMSPTVHAKYAQLLQKALGIFYTDECIKNDKRYVELILKTVATTPQVYQVRMLKSFLDYGHGRLVSDMYVRLAELYKKSGDTKRASQMLNEGILNKAEPKQLLEEMLTHVQLSWAEEFAKVRSQEATDGTQQNEGERNFASSVPIHGENNEAVSIRQNLQLAAPTGSCRQRTANDRRHKEANKLPVFNEEEGSVSSQSYRSTENGNANENEHPRKFQNLGGPECDRENCLEASKWNGGDAQLNNPAIPEPPKKLQLFVESDSFRVPTSSVSKKPLPVDKRVLKERAVEDEDSKEPEQQTGTIASQNEDNKTVAPISKNNKVDGVAGAKVSLPSHIQPMAKPRQNYNPKLGEDFFQDIKYKCLPEDESVDYVGLKEDLWWERREQRMKQKKAENTRILALQKLVDELQLASSHSSQSSKNLAEQLRLADVKLMQKDEKIKSLETENETLLQQLTDLTTKNNILESKYHREKLYLEHKVQELTECRVRFEEELQNYKAELGGLREKVARANEYQQMKDNESSDYEGIIIEKNSSAVDRRPITIDVRNRSSDNSASSSSEQISSEISRFNSGETTCAAANSFMPNEYDSSIIGNGNKTNSESVRDRMALVDRPIGNDMMNDTPATAPPMDFEIPPPTFSYGNNFFKKPPRLTLYESYSQDVSLRKTSKGGSFNIGSKRTEFAGNQESGPCSLPQGQGATGFYSNENAVPPAIAIKEESQPPFVPDSYTTSTVTTPSTNYQHENVARSSQFLKPDLPSFKKSTFHSNENEHVHATATADMRVPVSSNVTERLALLSSRPLNDYPSEDDEEDIIVRRHQQTGMDLNVSNLTTALMLGPKPLTNSTPERERTLRNLRGLAPSEVRNVNAQLEFEETVEQDYQGGISSRVARYNSVLNDPLNLSTIQETSRENQSRSRSTTGSSSGNTMSSTRFGITGSTTGTTPFFGNATRSASIPRSANRVSQQQCNNGYYSDTNTK